jgi:sialic acid synthase SpsE
MEPREFKAMVEAIRVAERALGEVHFGLTDSERSTRIFRRSLFVVRNVRQGEIFNQENVRSIRPGHGLHTRHLSAIVGKRADRDIERGTPLN